MPDPQQMQLVMADLQKRAQMGDPQAVQMLQQLMGGQGGPPQGGPPPGGMPPPGGPPGAGGPPPPGMGPPPGPPGQQQAMMAQALRGG